VPNVSRMVIERKFLLLIILVLFAIFAYSHLGLRYDLIYPDTHDYLYLREHAHEGVGAWLHAFFARPILTSLCLAVLRDGISVAVGQALISFAAWLFLAFAAAASVERARWSRVVFVIFLAGSVGRHTLYFNASPLSESLSLSAACVFIATLLRWTIGRGGVAAVASAALLLILSRDVWIYSLLGIAVMLQLLPGLRRRPASLRLSLLLAAVVVVGLWSAAKGERQVIPLKHVITHHIVDDAAGREFFARHGFAMEPAQWTQCWHRPFDECSFDANQEAWLRQHGKSTYQKWLLRTLPRRIVDMGYVVPDALTWDLVYHTLSQRNAVYDAVSRLSPIGHVRFGYLVAIAIAVTVLQLWLGKKAFLARPPIQLGLALTGAGLISLFVAYWGDGIEVARHLLLPAVLTSLGGWVLLCCQIDALLDRLQARRDHGRGTQHAALGL